VIARWARVTTLREKRGQRSGKDTDDTRMVREPHRGSGELEDRGGNQGTIITTFRKTIRLAGVEGRKEKQERQA